VPKYPPIGDSLRLSNHEGSGLLRRESHDNLERQRREVGLIRFGGHLPKGEYDVDHGGHEAKADAAELHRGRQDRGVRLVLDEGKTVAAAARDLGLTESSLRNWVEQARADRTKGKTGLTTAEREELARLRKEVRELRMERDVLKKPRSSSRREDGVVRLHRSVL
jgi:transposase